MYTESNCNTCMIWPGVSKSVQGPKSYNKNFV